MGRPVVASFMAQARAPDEFEWSWVCSSHLIVGHALTLHLFMVFLMSLIFITKRTCRRADAETARAESSPEPQIQRALGPGTLGQGKYVSHFINGLASLPNRRQEFVKYCILSVIWICTSNCMEIICRVWLNTYSGRKWPYLAAVISDLNGSFGYICFGSRFGCGPQKPKPKRKWVRPLDRFSDRLKNLRIGM